MERDKLDRIIRWGAMAIGFGAAYFLETTEHRGWFWVIVVLTAVLFVWHVWRYMVPADDDAPIEESEEEELWRSVGSLKGTTWDILREAEGRDWPKGSQSSHTVRTYKAKSRKLPPLEDVVIPIDVYFKPEVEMERESRPRAVGLSGVARPATKLVHSESDTVH